MRETVASQVPLVASSFDHPHVRELEEIGRVLDAHPELLSLKLVDGDARGLRDGLTHRLRARG